MKFVICTRTDEPRADVKPHRIYELIPDSDSESDGMIRIIDESGEDYLYPTGWFQPVVLSTPIQNLITTSVRRNKKK